MRILGIDPGKTNMALCLLTDAPSSFGEFTFQTWKLKAIDHDINAFRLHDLDMQLNSCIPKDIDLIVHEGIAFGEKFGVAESGMVQYIIQSNAIENNIKFITIASATMKRFLQIVTPKGGKSKGKTDLALAVYKKWQLDFPSQDETDSFILAQLGMAVLKNEFILTAPKKAVKKSRKKMEKVLE